MIQWNDSQKRAIKTKDKNILISASAGAGKTTVLIARLMHLMEQGVGVDEILAMTFSEAAAAEMKKRLSEELHRQLQKDPHDHFVRQQLTKLNTAYISTIHGFCLRIMQNYYYIVGLDKQRVEHIIDDADANDLKQRAMREVLTKYYEHPHFFQLTQAFSNQLANEERIQNSILALATLANAKADRDMFLTSCVMEYQEITQIKALPEDIKISFLEYFKTHTDLLVEALEKALEHHDNDAIIQKCLGYKKAMEALKAADYAKYHELFLASIQMRYEVPLSDPWVKKANTLEKKILENLFEEDQFVCFHNQVIKDIHLFCEITKAYIECFDRLKQEEKVIDFNDMEQYALKILKADNGYVASLYRNKFKTIMVDEFQDSNDIQDELVKCICRSNNVFRVGDIKQSIYGFRHALPTIMKSLMQHKTTKDELIYLGHNYRSSKKIVDFNNQLFDTLMNARVASSTYTKEDHVITGKQEQKAFKQPVQLHLIDPVVDEQKAYTSNTLKYSYIAHMIEDLHAKGKAYKDIVVLARGNTHLSALSDELMSHNIPCFYKKPQGFYDNDALQTVLHYLKALDNPYDEIALLSVLTSPFYKQSAEDLAMIKLQKGKLSYYEYVKDQAFFEPFQKLKEKSTSVSLSKLFDEVYAQAQYYENYTTRQEKANLDLLYELAYRYEQEQAISLHVFLRRVEKQKESKVAEAMSIGKNDDVVQLMSIHKSKGLQFKVVILFVGGGFSLPESKDIAVFDERLRMGMKYVDKKQNACFITPEILAMYQKKNKEMIEEEIRILYVATTRPQEELHIVDIRDGKEYPTFSANVFYKSKNYSDWIMSVFTNQTSDVFEYKVIDTMWEFMTPKSSTEKQRYIAKAYHKECEKISLVSPSDTELSAYTPKPFVIEQSDRFARGVMLHKMVERLDRKVWSVEDIRQVAAKQDFVLLAHDVDVLIKLSQNAIFKQATKLANVYHEFPYAVKEKQVISHGFMDFLAYDERCVVMVDFKSDRGIETEVFMHRYKQQILAYRSALHILFAHHEIKTYMYSFELAKMLEVK
ncbi:MAG: UvrD-helicase domain-containing protein [Breznakia sp.]